MPTAPNRWCSPGTASAAQSSARSPTSAPAGSPSWSTARHSSSNFIQTASEQLARHSFGRLVLEPYRPVFEPIRLRRPVHRELPATFIAFTRDQTMPPRFWHAGMSQRLNGAFVARVDGDHEMPLTAPQQLGDTLHRISTASG